MFGDGFGTFCVTIDREYPDYTPGKFINYCGTNRENDRLLNVKEYLTEIVILSTCNAYVASKCSGAMAVMTMQNNFEHTYIFDLGRYGVNPPVDWRKLIGQ